MSTALASAPSSVKEQQPYIDPVAKRHTGKKLLAVLVFWLLCWVILRGKQTLVMPNAETNALHEWLNEVRDKFQLMAQDNWFFHGVLGGIASAFDSIVGFLQAHLSSILPGDWIGWFGVFALFAWVTYALAGLRSAIMVSLTLLAFGVFGLWTPSIDTLIVTFMAVLISCVIGLPIGIAMARNKAVSGIVTPILDIMQTMPSFAYLSPVALFFGIGPATSVVLTLIYALPPLIRITEHGIRSVSANTIEAARSLGVTRGQLLRQVQLPMAKRTIVVGINQCTMAALSMATIAALVNGPGLGRNVVDALQTLNVGQASVAGIAIVLIAIMLDRTTTAASERTEKSTEGRVGSVGYPGLPSQFFLEHLPRWATEDAGRGARGPRLTPAGRRLLLGVLLLPALAACLYSTRWMQLAIFPDVSTTPVLKEFSGGQLAKHLNTFSDTTVNALSGACTAFKNAVTYGFLNPLQSLLANCPWWTMAIVILAVAYILGGIRPLIVSAVCEAVIFGTGLWNDAMVTLTMTLVATALVMIVAVVLGVGMGRSRRVDIVIRPFLDGFQTIPAFVYLVPALALFAATRFTAIVAAMAYAVPIATKLVADGIRGVSPATVEAARSTGSTTWQMISKVQLPMARESLVLATNQGLLYVLSMVVIGGMVGGGSLGYIIVQGFSRGELFGKGLAAGIAITAMGVMLDRIARYAAERYGR